MTRGWSKEGFPTAREFVLSQNLTVRYHANGYADCRRKLFSSKEKTKVCRDIEVLLGEIIDDESVTNIICRNCASKISNCVKQIVDVRQKYKETQENLQRKRQVTPVKRMCWPEIVDGASFKRSAKELFPVFPAPTAANKQTAAIPFRLRAATWSLIRERRGTTTRQIDSIFSCSPCFK